VKLDCSVIIATRGPASGLARALSALSSQTLDRSRYELVVVDNNESADTSAALERMLAPFDVVLVREPTRGAGAARNAGEANSVGGIVVFVDDDIEVDSGFLDAHLFAHQQGADVAVGPIVELNAHSSWFRRYLVDRRVINRAPDPNSIDFRNVYGANSSVAREVFDSVGGFDPAFLRREDAELGFRLVAAGATFAFADAAVGSHHSSFGPLDHLRRSYVNGHYLARLVEKHPAAAEYEKMQNYGWGRAVLAGVVALPLLLVGLVAYPVTRRAFHKGITALVLVQNARGFNAYRRSASQP
jgi:glycosyltransferase involved in cell wall biosynthesis